MDEYIIRRHLVTAQMVKNRLDSAKNGDRLTAEEITRGVRLDFDEYLSLVKLAIEGYRASMLPPPDDKT